MCVCAREPTKKNEARERKKRNEVKDFHSVTPSTSFKTNVQIMHCASPSSIGCAHLVYSFYAKHQQPQQQQ